MWVYEVCVMRGVHVCVCVGLCMGTTLIVRELEN